MTIRAGIFAAVSSDEQAQDKESLPKQLEECRRLIAQQGGVETSGPFIADGYSRSFYEGLSDAMADIPPLADAIKAAERNEYDVLFVRYFDRLGTVAYSVFVRLSKLKKQLRSVQEFTPIIPPAIYEPSKDNATSTMIHLSGVSQDHRINRLINNARDSMPKRIKSGLHPGKIPYGYKHVNNKEPAQQVPEEIAKLLQARELLFQNVSLGNISKILGVDESNVARILSNPFYAGQTVYGQTYVSRTTGAPRQLPQTRQRWIVGDGKHEPVWTPEEYNEILSELERRRELVMRREPQDALAGLLHCGVCGGPLRRWWTRRDIEQVVPCIICRKGGVSHVKIKYNEFFASFAERIKAMLRESVNGEQDAKQDARAEKLQAALTEKRRRRGKIQEGYEASPPLYTAAEAAAKLREIDREMEQIERDLDRITREQQARHDANSSLAQLESIEDVGWWLEHDDPKIANRLLSSWLRSVTVYTDGTMDIVRR